MKDKHYKTLGTDVFKLLKDNASAEEAIGFLKYNIIKYAMREKGNNLEDTRKIRVYQEELDWWYSRKIAK